MNNIFEYDFPAIIKQKIQDGSLIFPNDTMFEFHCFNAFRCYMRESNDKTPINRDDFRSQGEMKRRLRGNAINKPQYYGTSLFKDIIELKNIASLNTPNTHIAEGLVNQESGPIQIKQNNSHVCWWMIEKADISTFKEVK